ncbi:MAG: type II secretion system minor pseudopilin GspJ [Colwellia sp.]
MSSSAKLSTQSSFKGFTLLEVLIAIAIFSIISLSSFTIFDTVLKGDENAKLRTARQNELQRAFLLIERDITQLARRTIRLNGEAPLSSFLQTGSDNFFATEQALSFVRYGWTNPDLLLPRSDMQAVAYRVEDEVLQRLHFNFVDSINGEEPKVRPLISGVSSLSFQFYDGKKWQDEWASKTIPLAIAIDLETHDYGFIRRQFLVAGDAVGNNDDS